MDNQIPSLIEVSRDRNNLQFPFIPRWNSDELSAPFTESEVHYLNCDTIEGATGKKIHVHGKVHPTRPRRLTAFTNESFRRGKNYLFTIIVTASRSRARRTLFSLL